MIRAVHYSVFLLSIQFSSCTGEAPVPTAQLGQGVGPTAEVGESEVPSDEDEGVELPNYDNVNVGGVDGFNRDGSIRSEEIDPELANKVFKIQSVNAYRTVYVDIRKDRWQGFSNFTSSISDTLRGAGAGFVSTAVGTVFNSPDEVKPDAVSFHQPLTQAAIAFDWKKGESFQLLGHTAVAGFLPPEFPTALIVNISQDQAAMLPPEDYEKQLQISVPGVEEIQQYCDEIPEHRQAMRNNDTVLCQDILQQNLSQADTAVRSSGMTNIGLDIGSSAYDEFLAKKSVVVWKPIPPAGYKCLGHIVSNKEKPSHSLDTIGGSTHVAGYSQGFLDWYKIEQQQQKMFNADGQQAVESQFKAAMFCVKEELLAKGKVGAPIIYLPEQDVGIFEVTAADETGFGETNLFISIKGTSEASVESQIPTTEVWVLKRDIIKREADVLLESK